MEWPDDYPEWRREYMPGKGWIYYKPETQPLPSQDYTHLSGPSRPSYTSPPVHPFERDRRSLERLLERDAYQRYLTTQEREREREREYYLLRSKQLDDDILKEQFRLKNIELDRLKKANHDREWREELARRVDSRVRSSTPEGKTAARGEALRSRSQDSPSRSVGYSTYSVTPKSSFYDSQDMRWLDNMEEYDRYLQRIRENRYYYPRYYPPYDYYQYGYAYPSMETTANNLRTVLDQLTDTVNRYKYGYVGNGQYRPI